QVLHVARVEEVETAVRENDLPAGPPRLLPHRPGLGEGQHLARRVELELGAGARGAASRRPAVPQPSRRPAVAATRWRASPLPAPNRGFPRCHAGLLSKSRSGGKGHFILEGRFPTAQGSPAMFLKQYYLGCLAHASYLLGDESTGAGIVVD